jgi:hypothetical protein
MMQFRKPDYCQGRERLRAGSAMPPARPDEAYARFS